MDGDPTLLELRLSGTRWMFGTNAVMAAGLGIFFLILAAVKGQPVGLLYGLVFLVLAGWLGYLNAPDWRHARLTRNALVIPGRRQDHHVPVATIAGVGMCFVAAGRATGWRTAIWTTDGRGTFVVSWLWVRRGDIATSVGAQQTKAVWDEVCRIQGPRGPLATLATQHHVPKSWARQVWCPDDATVYRTQDPS